MLVASGSFIGSEYFATVANRVTSSERRRGGTVIDGATASFEFQRMLPRCCRLCLAGSAQSGPIVASATICSESNLVHPLAKSIGTDSGVNVHSRLATQQEMVAKKIDWLEKCSLFLKLLEQRGFIVLIEFNFHSFCWVVSEVGGA